MAAGLRGNTSTDTYLSSYGSSIARAAIRLNPFSGTDAGTIQFFTDPSSTVADGTAITPTERMRISSGGNVGIGATSPGAKLEIEASSTSYGGGLRLGESGSTDYWEWVPEATKLSLGRNSSTLAVIDDNGNVGIGATSPGALLQLGQSASPAKLGVLGLAGSTSGMVSLQPAAAAGTWTLTLPTSAGTSGQFLQTNGSGVTSWATAGGAPTNATYITQTADSTLSAEQALGSLATGILKNTTTTGVLSIAAAGTDYESPLTFSAPLSRSGNTVSLTTPVSVTNGGTGANLSTTGGANQFVKQSTAGGAFTVGTIADADVPDTITLSNLTQITTRAISDTTGTLAVGRGGTGATTLTTNGVLLGNGASAISATAAGTADQVLRIPSAGGAPVFGAVNLASSSAVTGALPVANGGTGKTSVTAYALLAGGTTTTGAFQSLASLGTSGQVLVSNGSGALPTWQDNPGGWNVSTANGTTTLSNTTHKVGIGVTTPAAKTHVYGDTIFLDGAGTITTNGTAVTGSSTQFGTQIGVGDNIRATVPLSGLQVRKVVSIASSTSLTIDSAFSSNLVTATSYEFQSSAFRITNSINTNHSVSVDPEGTFRIKPSAAALVITDTNGVTKMSVTSSGRVDINPTALGTTNDLRVGKAYIDQLEIGTSCNGCSSDLRLKKNIAPLVDSLGKLTQLQGVKFDWRKDEFPNKVLVGDRQIGFIAQEIEKIFPELVSYDRDGYRLLDYAKLTAILVEGIKEQQTEIESQEKEIERQGSALLQLQKDVQALKKAIKK